MNVIFTCGGTGGHINPAIAVANIWKERHPDSNILFIGADGGMEEQLVPKAGFQLKTLPGGGLSRSLSFAGIKKNVKVMYNLMSAVNRCKKIIKDFDADSLDIVDMVMTLEDEFGIEIPDEAIIEMHTIGDVVRYVEANKAD